MKDFPNVGNNVTSVNVEPGMVLSLGAGTSNYRYAEVENVVRMPPNADGYVTAHVTFVDDEPITIFGGQVYQRRLSMNDVMVLSRPEA